MTASKEVQHLVNLLHFVAEHNAESKRRTRFHATPTEPLLNLVDRLSQRIRCSPSCYAVALVYIDRATHGRTDLPLTLNTVQRLFTTALLVANQFVDDTSECAVQFARVARIQEKDMAKLKTELVFRLRFNLSISPQEINNYSNKLVGRFSSQRFVKPDMWWGEPDEALRMTPSANDPKSCMPVAVCPASPVSCACPKGGVESENNKDNDSAASVVRTTPNKTVQAARPKVLPPPLSRSLSSSSAVPQRWMDRAGAGARAVLPLW